MVCSHPGSLECGSVVDYFLTGKLWLFDEFHVLKSQDLPPQAIIDRFTLRMGIGMETLYTYEDHIHLATLFFQEIKKRLDAGESVEDLIEQRWHISYDIHKQWHAERYVSLSLASIF